MRGLHLIDRFSVRPLAYLIGYFSAPPRAAEVLDRVLIDGPYFMSISRVFGGFARIYFLIDIFYFLLDLLLRHTKRSSFGKVPNVKDKVPNVKDKVVKK